MNTWVSGKHFLLEIKVSTQKLEPLNGKIIILMMRTIKTKVMNNMELILTNNQKEIMKILVISKFKITTSKTSRTNTIKMQTTIKIKNQSMTIIKTTTNSMIRIMIKITTKMLIMISNMIKITIRKDFNMMMLTKEGINKIGKRIIIMIINKTMIIKRKANIQDIDLVIRDSIIIHNCKYFSL